MWNEDEQWIEMRLRAEQPTEVSLTAAELTVRFDQGEELLTEISAKFTPERIEQELSDAGFVVDGMWGAEEGEFLLTLGPPLLLSPSLLLSPPTAEPALPPVCPSADPAPATAYCVARLSADGQGRPYRARRAPWPPPG